MKSIPDQLIALSQQVPDIPANQLESLRSQADKLCWEFAANPLADKSYVHWANWHFEECLSEDGLAQTLMELWLPPQCGVPPFSAVQQNDAALRAGYTAGLRNIAREIATRADGKADALKESSPQGDNLQFCFFLKRQLEGRERRHGDIIDLARQYKDKNPKCDSEPTSLARKARKFRHIWER